MMCGLTKAICDGSESDRQTQEFMLSSVHQNEKVSE